MPVKIIPLPVQEFDEQISVLKIKPGLYTMHYSVEGSVHQIMLQLSSHVSSRYSFSIKAQCKLDLFRP